MSDNYQVDPEWADRCEGEKISLRDTIAIHAMNALMARKPAWEYAAIAKSAYKMADAMLAARNRRDEPDLSGFNPSDDDPTGR